MNTKHIVRLLVLLAVLLLGACGVRAANAQEQLPDQPQLPFLTEGPRYGGAFSKMQIVYVGGTPMAVMIEGGRRVVIYEAKDRYRGETLASPDFTENMTSTEDLSWIADMAVENGEVGTQLNYTPRPTHIDTPNGLDDSRDQNPPRLAATEDLGRVWGLAAEVNAGSDHITFYTISQSRSNNARVIRWSVNPSDYSITNRAETFLSGALYVSIADDHHILVTGNTQTTKLDKQTLTPVATYCYAPMATPPGCSVYMEIPVFNGLAYLPAQWGKIDVVDVSTMNKVDEWNVGRFIEALDVSSNGKYLMVQSNAEMPDGSDYLVYNRTTRELKLDVWNGVGFNIDDSPRTFGTVEEGHLLISGGYAHLQAYEIETGEQLMGRGHQPLGGKYPSEVVRIGNHVFVLDTYSGVLKTLYSEQSRREGNTAGGYFATVPLIPSLSDVSRVMPVGDYLAVAGGGLYIYDTRSDRIIDYTGFVNGTGTDSMAVYINPPGITATILVGDSHISNVQVELSTGRILSRETTPWLGDIFVPVGEYLATLTTNASQPALVSMTRVDGTVRFVIVPGLTPEEYGVDITTDGNRVYVLTKKFGEESLSYLYALQIVYHQDTDGVVLIPAWREQLFYHNRSISAEEGKQGHIWSGGAVVELLRDEGMGLSRLSSLHEPFMPYGNVTSRGNMAIASGYWRMYVARDDRGQLNRSGALSFPGPIESTTFVSDQTALAALGSKGVQVVNLMPTATVLHFPIIHK